MSEYESIPVGSVSAEFWQQCINPQSATQRKEVNEFLKTHGYIWTRSGSDWMLTKNGSLLKFSTLRALSLS
ncbi:MAG: hypothetical protein HC795_02285 [Coleofasciculaceae cyanobacterium RL_1_1]|nr:hypothetical protein [Coleofasciculaceae cyanobacterium RL_1_1]